MRPVESPQAPSRHRLIDEVLHLLQFVGGRGAIGVAHDLGTDVVVRHLGG